MSVHEFNNRIAAQRTILKVVNSRNWKSEQLISLSRKAINRWVSVNRLDPGSILVKLLLNASAKLFFLANRSQEQVSDEYRSVSASITGIYAEIERELGIPS